MNFEAREVHHLPSLRLFWHTGDNTTTLTRITKDEYFALQKPKYTNFVLETITAISYIFIENSNTN